MQKFILHIALVVCSLNLFGQNSPLASGHWVRMDFTEPGVYKISHEQLKEMGFDVATLDPQNIQLFGLPGGMLPQQLDAQTPRIIQQIPIQLDLQSNDRLSPGDHIYFNVDEINKMYYDTEKEILVVEENLYADHISYFLTAQKSNGQRIVNAIDLGRNFPSYNDHQVVITHEEELTNILKSGREWFGERLSSQTLSFAHPVTERAKGEAKLYIEAMSQAFQSTSLAVNIENSSESLNFGPIPNRQYGIKGNLQQKIIPFEITGNEINISLNYQRNGSTSAVSYLNRYLIAYSALNILNENYLLVNSNSLNQPISEFSITSDQNIRIWNVTDPLNPKEQDFEKDGSINRFSTFTDELQKFWVFDPSNTPSPPSFEVVKNQNLLAGTPELIIITHANFLRHAKVMAEFRRSHDQMQVQVATVEAIYQEYGAGRPDVTAIRNFIKDKYDQSQALKYVLLLGKGSFDYKDRLDQNANLVPTYESRNSLEPLKSYSSDDYFGFLDDGEGDWVESRAGDHDLEIGIGRIPVSNTEQADHFLEKWLNYQLSEESLGHWRTKVTFIADDGDRNIHQRDADILARTVDTNQPDFEIDKLYLDAFKQESRPNGEVSPDAEEALLDAVHEGRLLINYTGHGAESGWMQERVLTFENMQQWNNTNKLPFLVTATCEFGRNDDPETISGAEFLLTKRKSGAIGLVTTARPVFSSTNFSLNEALYKVMLKKENGSFNALGDIIRFTKNNSLQGSLNRNFILLGDPSMVLAFPNEEAIIESINGLDANEMDTIRAFETIRFNGRIKDQPDFQGTLNFELLDKAKSKRTIGTESDVFTYEEKDQVLTRGSAVVENGQFELLLKIPQNIDYNFGEARLQMYAESHDDRMDAFGAFENFVIGGTATGIAGDNKVPQGNLFINDTTQSLQPSYPSSLTFLALLEDENGINISANGLNQDILLTVNDSAQYVLNDFFFNLPGQFERGFLSFPMFGLPSGTNSFKLSFWDNRGNRNEQNIVFNVEGNSSIINEIKNYPNPLKEVTNFVIEHKLKNEILDISIRISDLNGKTITELVERVNSSSSEIILQWDIANDLGRQLQKGVYIYEVLLRSITSGLSDSKANKLIISY
jgi:hypothetical protein